MGSPAHRAQLWGLGATEQSGVDWLLTAGEGFHTGGFSEEGVGGLSGLLTTVCTEGRF